MTERKPIWIPTWLGLLIAAAVLWLVVKVMTGGQDPSVASTTPSTADQQAKELAWTERGKQAVKAKLKDPDSAQFRGIRFHQGKDGVPMACGEVNSKNSFGGYGGFQKFVSAGSVELTFLAEQMESTEFAKVWNQMCAG